MRKVRAFIELIRLNRQYGTLLLMMPALWSLFLAARGRPPIRLIAVFVAGAFLMRSAGCVLNDIADRNLDRYVERTRNRPLASGELTVREALLALAVLIGLSASLLIFLSPLAVRLSFIALGLAAVYPVTKRFFDMPQAILGIAFGWGAVMAWAAVREEVGPIPLLLLAANLFWATGYDTIYGLMDREDDRRIGIRSTAILFGRWAWAATGILYLAVVIILALVGREAGLGKFFDFALVFIGFSFLYQVLVLSRDPSPALLFRLFKSNVGIGALILLAIVLDLRFVR